ncbi:SurA N-terminal domain-containing protein [Candidatus Cardinium hertigii]|uniref:SurA N-terminal domain-containing protein n=1 Tax=Candidatus Cardinium hertigii TaxID=247481 RepID=UPI001FAA3520|nr:SurA N-terminal domain-containing protein [Candidatus Cardinium hertigii]
MAILGNFRKTGSTFVVVVISFFVMMFLGSELPRLVPYFFASKDQIGTLSGQKISCIDYYKLCDAIRDRYPKKGEQLTQKDASRIKDCAWRYLIDHMLYSKEIEAAGMLVGPRELVDLVQGEHIDAELLRAFKDPKTDTFDKQKLLNYLKDLDKSQQAWWCEIEKQFAFKRAKEKLNQLMVKSYLMTTSEMAQAAKQAGLFCTVDYIYIPFTSIKDDVVPPLTNQQLRDYMVAHKNHYKAPSDSRTIQYITFPIQPDEKDHSDFQKELNSLVVEFSTTTDPYTFAKQHTDGNPADTQLVCTVDTLPHAFRAIKHTLKVGMIVGPIVDDQVYTLYKLIKQGQGNYEIASIEKKQKVSEHTRNKHFTHLQHLTGQLKNVADLEQLATKQQLTIQKETLAPSDSSIGVHAAARKVVRWLYHEASLGKVSPIFDVGNAYLLAIMVDQVKAGDLLPLDSVLREVYSKVLHQKKAQIILDKLKQVQATTLQGIAEQYGEDIRVESVADLRFLDNDHAYLKQAQAFVGSCFGLKLNVISHPIIDEQGIFIACVKNRDKQETEEKHSEQMSQIERWMQPHYITKAMEELEQITDERYKFE